MGVHEQPATEKLLSSLNGNIVFTIIVTTCSLPKKIVEVYEQPGTDE